MPKDDAAQRRKALPIRILSCFLPDAKAKYVPVLLSVLAAPALALQQEKLEAAK